jgi:hypothetical protein
MITKIMILLFALSCVNIIRQLFFIFRRIVRDDVSEPYILFPRELWFLALSIAFIITIIFTGFKV